ncbi:LysR family transcriptional regulator [Tahibacter amnicola]|uniref:LysR family transcriptional regulator n=1 Tax=Tahibacter amnicola TaxID=2976241 RepID=A0ABY6BK62_9GAMM|nr:LysR family transcriptional regulator [Tahibacter amnicola]UXI69862.1 LysR family transcriptional regulator [Tahibacter amnicola]
MAVTDRLSGIAEFVQSVEAGSFAEAAGRLHLSRSAVGKTIARLEQRLGARLFHRTTRQLSLTEDGQAFYERCVRALAELEAAQAALDSGRQAPTGRLRVSAPVLFGRHCVAPVLTALARAHPRLTVELSLSDRVVDLVDEGFDLAVRIGRLPDSALLAARRLTVQRMAVCASPGYLARHGTPRTIEDLAGHTGVVYARAGQDKRWRILDNDGRVHEPAMDSRLRFDDLQAIADAAVAGAGLAWLPCWLLARHVRAGELVLVMDSRHVQSADIHAVWPQSRFLPAKTRAGIDALVDKIPAMIEGGACA